LNIGLSESVQVPDTVRVPQPLCIVLPEIGVVSETFIRWDVSELLPGGTVVVADPPPDGVSVRHDPAWGVDGIPSLVFTPVEGDPPPSAERRQAVAAFLGRHGVEVVLVEYLDFADRWFDLLGQLGLRVWLRGHGIDVSARLREARWRRTYLAYQAAAGIIVPSTAAATSLHALGLPPEKMHVVRYGVQVPDPPRRKPEPRDEVSCVAVGRLVPKKAPLLLLAAFHRAADHDERLTLDVVGDGPLMDLARSYVQQHGLDGRVRLHGRLPHPQTLDLVRDADILLHHAVTSSTDGDTEGQPLAILEAMAAGVPVIATDHAGIPEVVTDRVNGRLVAEGDVEGMAAALRELAADADARHTFGLAARTTIQCGHTMEHARRRLLTLLQLPVPATAVAGAP
jgi:colanic acid/amylovoran biosynthesis glycosyltransferase